MPTDTPTDEREMAREALGLLAEATTAVGSSSSADGRARYIATRESRARAAGILNAFGPCPGFWGEVLAAVRVLADWPVCVIAQPKVDGHFWTITLPWTDTPRTITADTEPAAILAALRAVVGAADA